MEPRKRKPVLTPKLSPIIIWRKAREQAAATKSYDTAVALQMATRKLKETMRSTLRVIKDT